MRETTFKSGVEFEDNIQGMPVSIFLNLATQEYLTKLWTFLYPFSLTPTDFFSLGREKRNGGEGIISYLHHEPILCLQMLELTTDCYINRSRQGQKSSFFMNLRKLGYDHHHQTLDILCWKRIPHKKQSPRFTSGLANAVSMLLSCTYSGGCLSSGVIP